MKWSELERPWYPPLAYKAAHFEAVEGQLLEFADQAANAHGADVPPLLTPQTALVEIWSRGLDRCGSAQATETLCEFLDETYALHVDAAMMRRLGQPETTLGDLTVWVVEHLGRRAARFPAEAFAGRDVCLPTGPRTNAPNPPSPNPSASGSVPAPPVRASLSPSQNPRGDPPRREGLPLREAAAVPDRPVTLPVGRPLAIRPASFDGLPFTQKRGTPPTADEWLTSPVYEPHGKTREGFAQYLRRTDGMRCVMIPAASVEMLADPATAASADMTAPATYSVAVEAFLIDAEPVSAGAYARFLNAVNQTRRLPEAIIAEWLGQADQLFSGGYEPLQWSWLTGWSAEAGREMQPMTLVSWYGANAYALWANRWDWRYYNGQGVIPEELTAHRVEALCPSERDLYSALPSEVQWEYAARGTKPRRYPWGDTSPTPEKVCVLKPPVANPLGAAFGGPAFALATDNPPAPEAMVNVRLGVSPFGCHHMAGHVAQWCRDYFARDFTSSMAARRANPLNREPADSRSERGGSAGYHEGVYPTWQRRGRQALSRSRLLGFRCVGLADEV